MRNAQNCLVDKGKFTSILVHGLLYHVIYFGQAARAAGGEAHSTNKKHPDALVTDATINLIPFLCVFPPVRAAVNQFQLSDPNFVKEIQCSRRFS